MFSEHPFDLNDLDPDELFFEELRWTNPTVWFEREEEKRNIQNNKRLKRISVAKRPRL